VIDDDEALVNLLPALAQRLGEIEPLPGDPMQSIADVLAAVMDRLPGVSIAPPPLSTIRGVQPQHLRSLIEAGAAFAAAEPWMFLDSDVLLCIEEPAAPRKLAYAHVMGRMGQQLGLALFKKQAHFEEYLNVTNPFDLARKRELWGVTLDPVEEMEKVDRRYWQEHGLPLGAEDLFVNPLCFKPNGEAIRPNLNLLTYMDSLLRACAGLRPEHVTAGQLTQAVTTARSSGIYRITIKTCPPTG